MGLQTRFARLVRQVRRLIQVCVQIFDLRSCFELGGIEPTGLKLSHKSIKRRGLYHEWNIGWQDKLVGKAAWKSDFVRR